MYFFYNEFHLFLVQNMKNFQTTHFYFLNKPFFTNQIQCKNRKFIFSHLLIVDFLDFGDDFDEIGDNFIVIRDFFEDAHIEHIGHSSHKRLCTFCQEGCFY